VAKLAKDVGAAMKDPKVIDAMMAAGAEPAEGTPEEFDHFIHEELDKWGRLEDQLAKAKGK
jgi:tripartite-type tricarboxylate transporter receptor subunit TctC